MSLKDKCYYIGEHSLFVDVAKQHQKHINAYIQTYIRQTYSHTDIHKCMHGYIHTYIPNIYIDHLWQCVRRECAHTTIPTLTLHPSLITREAVILCARMLSL